MKLLPQVQYINELLNTFLQSKMNEFFKVQECINYFYPESTFFLNEFSTIFEFQIMTISMFKKSLSRIKRVILTNYPFINVFKYIIKGCVTP